jgi:alpha-soluble NSF attachment protein
MCRLKIADFSAELGQYSKAVELYEEAAKRAVENNLLKFSARGYLLNAGGEAGFLSCSHHQYCSCAIF